jgi:hypothetical protein
MSQQPVGPGFPQGPAASAEGSSNGFEYDRFRHGQLLPYEGNIYVMDDGDSLSNNGSNDDG